MTIHAKERISAVSKKWFLQEPLLFDVFCTHALKENKALLRPFRTGQRRIEYNPDLIADMPQKAVEAHLQAEVLRILLKHPYQRVPKEPNLAALSRASDVTICENCPVSLSKIPEIPSAQHYNLSEKLSYEDYYRELCAIFPKIEQPSFSSPQHAQEEAEQAGVSYQTLQAAQSAALWAEDEETSESIDAQIAKAAATNQWGSVSGDAVSHIQAAPAIALNYRKILSQFRASMQGSLRTLTRSRPSRRYGYDYMGSRYKPTYHLLVAVDSSGSIEDSDLARFFSVINRFFKYGAKEIKVIVFDTKIQQEMDFKRAVTELSIQGRGGTDFQAAADYYERSKDYDGMIVFTDGYAPSPELKSKKRILWFLAHELQYEQNPWLKKLPRSQVTYLPAANAQSFH